MSSTPEDLIKKYLNNTCTAEERAILESWYNATADAAENAVDNVDYVHLEKQIWKELQKSRKPANKFYWPLVSAAAACLLICSLLFYTNNKTGIQKSGAATVNNLSPGSNKAELVLADGTVLTLSANRTGLLTRQNGVMISNIENGSLKYNISGDTTLKDPTYNTLRTPKGGQYQIDLPDGTRAWLNAASSLKFPTVFKGGERSVAVSGEVYFEVAINKQMPFKVISSGQTIEVLGTHFNLSTYADERLTKTTLIEGSVSVSSEKDKIIIKPGEQAVLNNRTQEITLSKADLEETLAWRKGYFQFNNEDVKSIMRKLSRWYNIDVDYSSDFVNQRFTGSISRFEEGAKVLKMLAYTGTVHFKTEGRRVTVMP